MEVLGIDDPNLIFDGVIATVVLHIKYRLMFHLEDRGSSADQESRTMVRYSQTGGANINRMSGLPG